MADEQTPQSDLIDDAIRQAERQLEAKLEALRMSALGEPAPSEAAPADDVAVLRPTGGAPRASEPAQPAPAPARTDEDGWIDPATKVDVPDEFPAAWHEQRDEELPVTPTDPNVTLRGDELYVPEQEHPLEDASTPSQPDTQPDTPIEEPAPLGQLSASVTDLTPVWDDEDEPSVAPPRPTTRRAFEAPVTEERPEPVHTDWTGSGSRARRDATPAARPTSLPSEDEMQFWAHTRTALRNLQQVTDGLGTQLTGSISTEVARIIHEEVQPTDQAVRTVQQQLQQGLPRIAEHVEASIEQSMTSQANALRQVRDEIPAQLERLTREQHSTLRGELDRQTGHLHASLQGDVAQLEQSVATNVTRMTQGTTEAIGRVERDVDLLGENVVRFERGVHSEFDRVESQLRSAIERVEASLREDLVKPTETIKKLDDELPARFGRVERTLMDQLQTTQREISTVLTGLVDANRASLDRIAALGSTLDEDRARRAEDVEVVVDTVTTGWEGMAGAMRALFDQAEENSRRIAGIEQRLTQIRDLEGAVEGTLEEFRRHMKDLKPSPIVVTVSHDDAEVRNTSRGGWVPHSEGTRNI